MDSKIQAAIKVGDLDLVKAFRSQKQSFEIEGKLPNHQALRRSVDNYQSATNLAKFAMDAAYAGAVRDYTKANQIAKAEAVKAELDAFRRSGARKKDLKLVALYRFYDKRLHEHVYTYGDGEPANWRKHPDMEAERIIGYATLDKETGSTRFWRAIRGDRKHYFYLSAPTGTKGASLEEFKAYVWTQKGDSRVPIYGCVLPDGTDLFLDPDAKKVSRFSRETLSGIGQKRISYSPAFYLYAKPPDNKAE